MQDVQNQPDTRQLTIDKVGVRDLRYPITVLDRANTTQQTIATMSMSVELPHHYKGTHMSRFIEVLEAHRGEVTMRTLPSILRELRERLDAERAHIEVEFPFFLERVAPVSKAASLLDYEGSFVGTSDGQTEDFVLGITVPVTSLCPCSKIISDYGAHNQRGHITIQVRLLDESWANEDFVWLEDLIEIAESSASAPLYPLLKRPDERHVTMQAYDNPVFVEDMVRNVAAKLQQERRVKWFKVSSINQESIHNHNAFAEISWTRP